jgi:microcystin-dependent protein
MTSRLRSVGNFSVHEKPSVGDTKISMNDSDHTGWVLCNGRALDKYLFNQLYQVIGTKYGGSGITFNLPNPKGRVLGVIGAGPGLTARAQGATVGAENHLLVENELPNLTKTTITNSGHTHTHNANGGSPGYGLMYRDGQSTIDSPVNTSATEPNLYQPPAALTLNTENAHTHTVQFGGGLVHNNMQPTMFVGNMFIYCGRPNYGTYEYTFKGYKYYKNEGTR